MKDLTTTYLGLKLKNPLIVGSCDFTNTVDKITELAANGAAAIVLKSLFEEQILAQYSENLDNYHSDYPGAVDYIREYTRGNEISTYLKLISDTKKAVDIPVIASINCVSSSEWVSFARSIEEQGADGLELNISLLPSDPRLTSRDYEKKYTEIISAVQECIAIPIALKMSHYSSSLANLIRKISWTTKVAGFVLFNRHYQPDFDIDQLTVTSADVLSSPVEANFTLRWIALLAGRVERDLVASTGIHDGDGVIKQLLAGATAVQVVSTLYRNGPVALQNMLNSLEVWMTKHGFNCLDDFRGKLSYHKTDDPAVFERTQFMKYYGGLS